MGTLVAAAFLGLRGEANERGRDMALHAPSLQDSAVGSAVSVTKSVTEACWSLLGAMRRNIRACLKLSALCWRSTLSSTFSCLHSLPFLQTQQAAAHLPPSWPVSATPPEWADSLPAPHHSIHEFFLCDACIQGWFTGISSQAPLKPAGVREDVGQITVPTSHPHLHGLFPAFSKTENSTVTHLWPQMRTQSKILEGCAQGSDKPRWVSWRKLCFLMVFFFYQTGGQDGSWIIHFSSSDTNISANIWSQGLTYY